MNKVHVMHGGGTSITDLAPASKVKRLNGTKTCPSGSIGIVTEEPKQIVWLHNGEVTKSMVDCMAIVGNKTTVHNPIVTDGMDFGVLANRYYGDGDSLILWISSSGYLKVSDEALSAMSFLPNNTELRIVCNLPE